MVKQDREMEEKVLERARPMCAVPLQSKGQPSPHLWDSAFASCQASAREELPLLRWKSPHRAGALGPMTKGWPAGSRPTSATCPPAAQPQPPVLLTAPSEPISSHVLALSSWHSYLLLRKLFNASKVCLHIQSRDQASPSGFPVPGSALHTRRITEGTVSAPKGLTLVRRDT